MPGRLGWIPGELAALGLAEPRRGPADVSGAAGPVVELDGRRLVNLCSTDHLGLASDPRVWRAAADAAGRSGAGGGGPALHGELERRLAALTGTEAALLFPSAWHARTGVAAALVGPEDAVFCDELSGGPIADGCRLSGASAWRYRHGDAEDLERLVASTVARRKLVITDAVFALEGDAAPLGEIAGPCRRHRAMLLLDETHAVGVLGRRGGGLAEAAGLSPEVDAIVGSLGGSLGSFGGFAAGPRALAEWLASRGRALVRGEALAPAACGAALAALEMLEAEPERRGKLESLSTRMRDGLEWLGFPMHRVVVPIFPLVLGEASRALEAARALQERGFLALAAVPPEAPPGASRLLLSLTSAHGREQVDGFLAALRDVLRESGWRPGSPPPARR